MMEAVADSANGMDSDQKDALLLGGMRGDGGDGGDVGDVSKKEVDATTAAAEGTISAFEKEVQRCNGDCNGGSRERGTDGLRDFEHNNDNARNSQKEEQEAMLLNDSDAPHIPPTTTTTLGESRRAMGHQAHSAPPLATTTTTTTTTHSSNRATPTYPATVTLLFVLGATYIRQCKRRLRRKDVAASYRDVVRHRKFHRALGAALSHPASDLEQQRHEDGNADGNASADADVDDDAESGAADLSSSFDRLRRRRSRRQRQQQQQQQNHPQQQQGQQQQQQQQRWGPLGFLGRAFPLLPPSVCDAADNVLRVASHPFVHGRFSGLPLLAYVCHVLWQCRNLETVYMYNNYYYYSSSSRPVHVNLDAGVDGMVVVETLPPALMEEKINGRMAPRYIVAYPSMCLALFLTALILEMSLVHRLLLLFGPDDPSDSENDSARRRQRRNDAGTGNGEDNGNGNGNGNGNTVENNNGSPSPTFRNRPYSQTTPSNIRRRLLDHSFCGCSSLATALLVVFTSHFPRTALDVLPLVHSSYFYYFFSLLWHDIDDVDGGGGGGGGGGGDDGDNGINRSGGGSSSSAAAASAAATLSHMLCVSILLRLSWKTHPIAGVIGGYMSGLLWTWNITSWIGHDPYWGQCLVLASCIACALSCKAEEGGRFVSNVLPCVDYVSWDGRGKERGWEWEWTNGRREGRDDAVAAAAAAVVGFGRLRRHVRTSRGGGGGSEGTRADATNGRAPGDEERGSGGGGGGDYDNDDDENDDYWLADQNGIELRPLLLSENEGIGLSGAVSGVMGRMRSGRDRNR